MSIETILITTFSLSLLIYLGFIVLGFVLKGKNIKAQNLDKK